MAMKTNVYGLLCATQKIAPGMIERINDNKQSSQCSILVTGATASLRGKPFTAGFAPQKVRRVVQVQVQYYYYYYYY
jgi:hypothetical protein